MGWQRNSTRVVYDNPWMTVREDEVVNPGGGENIYGHVEFKNVAVAILAIDDDDHTWLVGQSRYTLNRYSWELPMGGSPLGDAPLDGARRELVEETGLSAESWEEFMRLDTSNSITNECGIVYLATGLTEGRPQPEETEELKIRRLPVDDAVAMAFSGEITDAISVAALMRLGLARAGKMGVDSAALATPV